MGMTCFLFSSRPFCFKKKSSSGSTKADVPAKVISPSVLANRNVNVYKNTLVTKSPLTFSNKTERPQKSKISTFFPVSSKGKSDSVSPVDNGAPLDQFSSMVPAINATTAPKMQSDSSFASGTQSTSAILDTSLGFPVEDWDDFEDFDLPVKAKHDSCNSGKSGKTIINPESSPGDEKAQSSRKINNGASLMASELSSNLSTKNSVSTSEQSCTEMEWTVDDVAVVSPGPSLNQDPEECLFGDSPVRPTRQRSLAQRKSVLSNSEGDNNDEVEPFEETGNSLFVAACILFFR